MKPVCVPCERFMRCKTTGFYFTEGMPAAARALPGKTEPEKWKPYKLWVGDLYECPTCGASTIVGVPFHPLAEHYQPDFTDMQQRLAANQLLVKDC